MPLRLTSLTRPWHPIGTHPTRRPLGRRPRPTRRRLALSTPGVTRRREATRPTGKDRQARNERLDRADGSSVDGFVVSLTRVKRHGRRERVEQRAVCERREQDIDASAGEHISLDESAASLASVDPAGLTTNRDLLPGGRSREAMRRTGAGGIV